MPPPRSSPGSDPSATCVYGLAPGGRGAPLVTGGAPGRVHWPEHHCNKQVKQGQMKQDDNSTCSTNSKTLLNVSHSSFSLISNTLDKYVPPSCLVRTYLDNITWYGRKEAKTFRMTLAGSHNISSTVLPKMTLNADKIDTSVYTGTCDIWRFIKYKTESSFILRYCKMFKYLQQMLEIFLHVGTLVDESSAK